MMFLKKRIFGTRESKIFKFIINFAKKELIVVENNPKINEVNSLEANAGCGCPTREKGSSWPS